MQKMTASLGGILLLGVLLLILVFFHTAPTTQAAGISDLHVSGNQLVNSTDNQIILRGVNRSGTEYACIQGWGIFDGPSDDASVKAIASWGSNVVNIGLNEDCWLGINGVDSNYSGSNYINALKTYVTTLENNNIYPVISLFWEAPGTQKATGQIAMPDADHATVLWQSVANTFKGDDKVIFRLKEEPFPDGNSDTTTAWSCWLNGGSACNEGYQAVGMQTLINTIRSTGATNVIQVPGIQYANTMTQFLNYKPTDPLNNLMAVVDVYPNGNICGDTNCYNSQYAPVIAQMPFIAGEFGESVDGNVCSTSASNTFMNWMDAHNSGYIAWVWDTWGTTCGDLSLITDYNGTAKSPNGTNFKNHLASVLSSPLPTQSPSPTPSLTPTVSPSPTPSSSPTVFPTPSPSPSTGSNQLDIYTNGLVNGFTNNSFSYTSLNLCDSSLFYSSPCSAAISFAPWGALNFVVPSTLDPSAYTTLVYKLNPGSLPISDFSALMTNSKGNVIKEVVLTNSMVTSLNNGWYQVAIPLSQLNPTGNTITTIQLKNALNSNLPSVHIDDVSLSGTTTTSNPTATVIEAESLNLLPNSNAIQVFTDNNASSGEALVFYNKATSSDNQFILPSSTSLLTIRAEGNQCSGAPKLQFRVDSGSSYSAKVSSSAWTNYTFPISLSAGEHILSLSYPNDYKSQTCDRNLRVDNLTFF